MSFTDDEKPKGFSDADLKRLKEYHLLNRALFDEFTGEQMHALLARLEAAESVIKEFRIPEDMPMGCVERWRKAAGKGTE